MHQILCGSVSNAGDLGVVHIPSNNDNLFLTRRLDLECWLSSACLDVLLRALDVDCAVLLDNVELVQVVWSWRVLDITSLDIKACWKSSARSSYVVGGCPDLHAMDMLSSLLARRHRSSVGLQNEYSSRLGHVVCHRA